MLDNLICKSNLASELFANALIKSPGNRWGQSSRCLVPCSNRVLLVNDKARRVAPLASLAWHGPAREERARLYVGRPPLIQVQ